MKLEGKNIFITGGSSGIGAALVRRCISEGGRVFFTYHENQQGAREVSNASEGRAEYIRLALSDLDEIQQVVEQARTALGGIDILVNNAGRYLDGDEWDGEYATWEQTFRENVLGAMEVSKHVMKDFIADKKGVIVNVSSRLGVNGSPEEFAYGAAKAALINVTQAQARALAPFGRANVISPSAVRAGYWLRASQEELDSVGPLVEVEAVAETIVDIASNESADITGQNVEIRA